MSTNFGGKENEDNEHFLLHCPLYDIIRQDLFGQLENILDFNVSDMDSKSFCDLLLFGKPDLDVSVNKMIVEETILLSKMRNDCRLGTII